MFHAKHFYLGKKNTSLQYRVCMKPISELLNYFLRAVGCFTLPITMGHSYSEPSMLAQSITVSQSLGVLLPATTSPTKAYILASTGL